MRYKASGVLLKKIATCTTTNMSSMNVNCTVETGINEEFLHPSGLGTLQPALSLFFLQLVRAKGIEKKGKW